MQIERCLWKRFAGALAAVGGLFVLFYGLLLIRYAFSREAHTDLAFVLQLVLHQLAKSGEVLIAVAAPIATLAVLWRVRRSGILMGLFAAGYPPARLRRTLLGLALLTFAAAAVAQEVSARALMPDPRKVQAWRSEALWGTPLKRRQPNRRRTLVVFRPHTLDAWEVTEWRWRRRGSSFRFLDTTTLRGDPLDAEGMDMPPPQGKVFRTAPLSRWIETPPPLPILLVTLLRVLLAPILVLAGAYLALVLPRDRLALVWPGLLLMLGLAATTTMVLGVLLRQAPIWGVAAALAYLGSLALLIARLERRLTRSGLRLAGEALGRRS